MSDSGHAEMLELTTKIVAAHVSRNQVEPEAVSGLIRVVYRSLSTASSIVAEEPPAKPPAVPIKNSVFPDYIICLENGRKLKTLKRHLRSSFGLTPGAYVAKWGLPADYPMVAPNYASRRSELARALARKSTDTDSAPLGAETTADPRVTMLPVGRAKGSK